MATEAKIRVDEEDEEDEAPTGMASWLGEQVCMVQVVLWVCIGFL